MIIEITQTVDTNIAQDLLAGQARAQGFILGYIKKDKHKTVMVCLYECAPGAIQIGQREVQVIIDRMELERQKLQRAGESLEAIDRMG